jgi:hypothetical protein
MIESLTLLAACCRLDGVCLGLLWRPIFTPPQIVLLAVVALGLAAFAYGRVRRAHPWASAMLLLMRLTALSVLVVLLLGPSDTPPATEAGERMPLAVVVDVSESMLTGDCEGRTRLETARRNWLTPRQVERLSRHCVVQLFGFAQRLLPLSWSELEQVDKAVRTGEPTDLRESLQSAIAAQRAGADAALLVLSDGHDTADADLQSVVSTAQARGIPIHTVAFGTESQPTDLVLQAVLRQDYLLPGEPGAILVRAYQFGLPQARTTLHLRYGSEHREIPIAFDGRGMVELQLEIKDEQPGQYEYQLLLDPLEAEVEQKNNQQTVFCQVQDRRIKVLMLEGQPYWDTKFLAQSLRKDERIELTQITQVSARNRETLVSRSDTQAPRVPSTPEGWGEYDVVVLGDDVSVLLNGRLAAQLRDFVLQQGGHVVFARGRCYDPTDVDGQTLAADLAAIEPVVWDDNVWQDVELRVTLGAVESSWLATSKMGADPSDALGQLPGLQAVQGVRRLKPSTRVLAEAISARNPSQTHPAIVTMAAGRGQVVALLGHDSWRWSLRPPTDESLVSFYDTFWSNLVRWLVMGGDFQPGHQVALKLSRQSLQLAEELEVEVVFKDPLTARGSWRIVWTDADGHDRELSLRRLPGRAPRFRTTVTPTATGVHQFELLTPGALPERQQQKLNVYDVSLERLETSARPQRLKQLAEATGGVFFDGNASEDFLEVIERQQLARQIPPEPRYVWDQAGIMTLLLMWIGSEWLFRRLAGLL